MKTSINQSIAIEDLAAYFVTEFVKANKKLFNDKKIPFLKMSFEKRRALASKVLDKISKD